MSLETLELQMNVENAFNVKITEADAINIFTVGDLSKHIAMLLTQKNGSEITYKDTLPIIIDILVKKHDIERSYINTTSRFVQDLGMG